MMEKPTCEMCVYLGENVTTNITGPLSDIEKMSVDDKADLIMTHRNNALTMVGKRLGLQRDRYEDDDRYQLRLLNHVGYKAEEF